MYASANPESEVFPWRVAKAPGGLPLIGHAVPLLRAPLAFLAAMPSYGDLVTIQLGPELTYMACHPQLVHRILLNPRVFEKGGRLFERARPSFGDGLVTASWREHRSQRKVLQPGFHRAQIPAFAAVMAREIDAIVKLWQPGEPLMVGEVIDNMTIRVAIRVLLSLDGNAPIAAEIQQHLPTVLTGLFYRTINPFTALEKLPVPSIRRHNHALHKLHTAVDEVIRQRRCNTEAGTHDLLTVLLDNNINHNEIHDQIMSFLIAATETTANVLIWAIYLLSQYSAEERRLAEEAQRESGHVFVGLDKFPVARSVFTEALRMYPPAWILPRITTTDTELAGQQLRAGTSVMYSPYALQRNPEYFAEPEQFRPERWLTPRPGDVTNEAMVPFGGGSRKCIGEHFAIVLGVLALTAITARWRLRPIGSDTVHPIVRSTIRMSPLHMIPVPR